MNVRLEPLSVRRVLGALHLLDALPKLLDEHGAEIDLAQEARLYLLNGAACIVGGHPCGCGRLTELRPLRKECFSQLSTGLHCCHASQLCLMSCFPLPLVLQVDREDDGTPDVSWRKPVPRPRQLGFDAADHVKRNLRQVQAGQVLQAAQLPFEPFGGDLVQAALLAVLVHEAQGGVPGLPSGAQ
ncbi:MAG: hypothetical protein H6742_15160 [Alphaproteobacteria bacterium]|nr:hypothetical protein [Alphaproteobacteria bacterium]